MDLTAADRADITELVLRFADAVTRHDPALFGSLWAETGTWQIDAPSNLDVTGTPNELAAILAAMPSRWVGFVQLAHGTTADATSDGARARSYMTELGAPRAGEHGYFNHAIYEDDLVLTDAGWRFARRRYRYLYLDDRPLPGRFPIELGSF
jgi:hypothetical protein